MRQWIRNGVGTRRGDRPVGYTLLPETSEVNQAMIKTFLERLRAAGVTPDEVITEDSRLYPSVLAEVWPPARHQLCLAGAEFTGARTPTSCCQIPAPRRSRPGACAILNIPPAISPWRSAAHHLRNRPQGSHPSLARRGHPPQTAPGVRGPEAIDALFR